MVNEYVHCPRLAYLEWVQGEWDDNLAEAVEITGAGMVDVSSGVEDTPGHKDPARITAFLETVAKIG